VADVRSTFVMSTRPLREVTASFAALALVVSCSPDQSEAGLGTWRAERDSVADTIIVRTISGSVWGEPATLVEEVASPWPRSAP
jgi:hypothetical protein